MVIEELRQRNFELIEAIDVLQHGELESLIEAALTGYAGKTYHVLSPAGLASKVAGHSGGLTEFVVKRLRKEFLTIMRSYRNIKNYDDALKVSEGVNRWRDHYLSIIKQIKPMIDQMMRSEARLEVWKRKTNELWGRHYRDDQKPLWDFNFVLNTFPLERLELAQHKYRGTSVTPEKSGQYYDFQRGRKKWQGQAERRSRAAWKWLKEFIEWTESTSLYGGGGEVLPIKHPEEKAPQNISKDGFSLQLVGYDHNDSHKRELMGRFERGLALYKKRAQRVFPWLLRYKIPFKLDFSSSDEAGRFYAATYEGDHVLVTFWGMDKSADQTAQYLAHEMGHHIYNTFFSQKMKMRWREFLRKKVDLDLKELVGRVKIGETDSEFEKRLEKEDPVTYLRLRTLRYRYPRRVDELGNITAIREYLNAGGTPWISVAALPISGYAATNEEEAFCEVLGNLVGFGPRTLLPEIKGMLKLLFPTIKLEGVEKPGLSSQLVEALLSEREAKTGRMRASKLQYIHFTDSKGALGMVDKKKVWQSEYAAPAVYAVAVGGVYVPSVQNSPLGRAKKRDVAVLFTTSEFPDRAYPEEVLWHKKEISVKSIKIIPMWKARQLLDGSLVSDDGDSLKGIPLHPGAQDWDTGFVRDPGKMSVGRPAHR